EIVMERMRVPAARSFFEVYDPEARVGKMRLSSACGAAPPTQLPGVLQLVSMAPVQILVAKTMRSSRASTCGTAQVPGAPRLRPAPGAARRFRRFDPVRRRSQLVQESMGWISRFGARRPRALGHDRRCGPSTDGGQEDVPLPQGPGGFTAQGIASHANRG